MGRRSPEFQGSHDRTSSDFQSLKTQFRYQVLEPKEHMAWDTERQAGLSKCKCKCSKGLVKQGEHAMEVHKLEVSKSTRNPI